MQKIELTVKDPSKLEFLLELFEQFDFVEVHRQIMPSKNYDLFASTGLWKNRDIDSKELRTKAWK